MPPHVTPKVLCLHLNQDTDLPRRHGARIRAAGGKFSDVRGHGSSHRFVHVPAAEAALVDELVRTYRAGPKTTIVVDGFEAPELKDGRIRVFEHANNTVMYWLGEEKSGTPSEMVAQTVARRVAAFDWKPWQDRWAREDADAAERSRQHRLSKETAEALEAIGAEALRILDGANDIDGLKDLAQRYRDLLAEAGKPEPESELGSASPRP